MKAQTAYRRTKIKNAPKKHLRGKIHLFAYLRFCAFAWASLYLLRFLCVSKKNKKNKEFKTALTTSFSLLLLTQ